MARTFRVHIDQVAVDQLVDTDQDTAAALMDAGWQIARDAQVHAVRDTGAGAASIRPWPGVDQRGPHVDVSWDQDHFYMSFHEFGTRRLSARPAVGPALDRYAHL